MESADDTELRRLCTIQEPTREDLAAFVQLLAKSPSATWENASGIRAALLDLRQAEFVSPSTRKRVREELSLDHRFCSPVLFTVERPKRNRFMWMGPPIKPDIEIPGEEGEPPRMKTAHPLRESIEQLSTKGQKKRGRPPAIPKEPPKREITPPPSPSSSTDVSEDDPRYQVIEPQLEMPRPPQLEGIDDYLDFVGRTYYQTSEHPLGADEFSYIRRTTLGLLKSNLRPPLVIDKWSPFEIAKFEAAICVFGKQFAQISAMIGTKTAQEVDEFFYVWKMSKNYSKWKSSFQPPELPFSR